MGAKELLEEIRNSKGKLKSDTTGPASSVTVQEPQTKTDTILEGHPRKRRMRKVQGESAQSANCQTMFVSQILGGMFIDGYPLEEGEKLVIAKLSPVKVNI